ncbi:respiratory nitrate reductase subunit gamma [candidate division KSB1 bacterium]|nr:respiratory nitrate reductase subunit gamma [candidate division KSB1 bacterium]
MPQTIPNREVFWNISYHWVLYPLLIITFAIFAYGIYRRIRLWRLGVSDNRFDRIGQRLVGVIKFGIAQSRLLKERYPGLMHLAIFVGFVLLLIGTATVSFDYDVWGLILGQPSFIKGNFYLYFSLVLDLAGVLTIIGLLVAFFRRYIQRPDRLNNQTDDVIVLVGLLAIVISGFFVEASRIAATQPSWEVWSPVGYALSGLFSGAGVEAAQSWHRLIWWLHLVLAFSFIGYIPFSKLFHIISAPTNIFFRSFQPNGQLTSIDIENAETFGAGNISDFSWKQLLDLDACTQCGRCQDNCPAYLSEKPLSPKKLILDLLTNLNQKVPQLLIRQQAKNNETEEPLVGSAVTPDEVWACTTCRACMEECPVIIEHVQKVVDLRRHLVLMLSQFPKEVQLVLKNLTNNFNPWGIGFSSRGDWANGLDVKTFSGDDDSEILYFVGCAGAFDDRYKKVAQSFVKILNAAGIKFGILGAEEKCCGDSARRIGEEYLFQTLAQENIATFQQHNVKKIVTTCPHGYNTLKNEYPQFNGNFEVIHAVELIADLLKQGKIVLKKDFQQSIVLHDSCYLGRYNNIYEQPREIIQNISGAKLLEMERNRDKSFCCGAGGGRMWFEETIGTRINNLRVEQALETKPNAVGVSCPFCLTMFEDGIKDKGVQDSVKTYDLIELVALSLEDKE